MVISHIDTQTILTLPKFINHHFLCKTNIPKAIYTIFSKEFPNSAPK